MHGDAQKDAASPIRGSKAAVPARLAHGRRCRAVPLATSCYPRLQTREALHKDLP